MISPQMSAWVRVWAWVSWRGALLLLGQPGGAQGRLRARGAAGAPRLLRLLPAPPDSGRGLRTGKLQHPNTNKQTTTTKIPRNRGGNGKALGGGAAGRALRAERRVPAGRRHRGEPRGQPGPGTGESCPGGRPCPGGGRSERPRVARRSGDRLSVAIKIKINSY